MLKKILVKGMLVHIFNLSTQEAETEESLWVWGQSGLYINSMLAKTYAIRPCLKIKWINKEIKETNRKTGNHRKYKPKNDISIPTYARNTPHHTHSHTEFVCICVIHICVYIYMHTHVNMHIIQNMCVFMYVICKTFASPHHKTKKMKS